MRLSLLPMLRFATALVFCFLLSAHVRGQGNPVSEPAQLTKQRTEFLRARSSIAVLSWRSTCGLWKP
jgi:hypothetical protein